MGQYAYLLCTRDHVQPPLCQTLLVSLETTPSVVLPVYGVSGPDTSIAAHFSCSVHTAQEIQ